MNVHLVAHRGECEKSIENTFKSVEHAINVGIKNIEIDIQITKEGIPILFHDRSLLRLMMLDKPVSTLTYNEISKLPYTAHTNHINHTNLKVQQTHSVTEIFITTLKEIISLINQHPEVKLFIEVKRINFNYFSYQQVYNIMNTALNKALFPVVVLSFSYRFLSKFQENTNDEKLCFVGNYCCTKKKIYIPAFNIYS